MGTGAPLEDEDANEEEDGPTDEEDPAMLLDDAATLEEETKPPDDDDDDEETPPLPDEDDDEEEALAELALAETPLEDVPPAEDEVATKPDVSLNAVEERAPLATREELFGMPPEDEVDTALLLELVGPPLLEEVSVVLVVHARPSTPKHKPNKRFMPSPVRGVRNTAQQTFPPF